MACDFVTTASVTRSSFEWDYEYDQSNDVFLFYPSRSAFESPRDELSPPCPTGFYNLPVFRSDQENLLSSLRSTESVFSDETAATYVDGDSYGREGEVLRSMGYSRCLCLGLVSISVPDWLHAAVVDCSPPALARGSIPFTDNFTKLWDKLFRR